MLEVALALGLFAFAIISILGLLAVTMNLDQDSANDTTVTRMSEETGAWLRSQPFATSHTAAAYAPTDTTPDFYYDAAGRMALTSTGAPATTAPADAYFSCTVTRRATPSNAMDVLVMTYSWPLKAQEAHRKTRRMHISISSGY
ncbi:hypothetical protein DB346_20940 [Verrucomicrobia bacterium LW23]|nr:hypothetical protein DB346_20940 [Verrucomicrobia bacterium LW23]